MTEQTNNAQPNATPDAKAPGAAPTDTNKQPAAPAADAGKKPDAAAAAKQPDAGKKPEPKNFLFGKKEEPKGAEGEAAKDKPKEGDGEAGEGEENTDAFEPEKLKLPEGMELDDTTKPIVSELAENISKAKTKQEAMQMIADARGKLAALELENFERMKSEWYEQIIADPEIGGKNADATQKRVDEVIRKFAADPQFGGSPELLNEFQEDLMYFGLGNRRSVVKFLNNIAKATAEENAEGSGGGGQPKKKTAAEVMYPDMTP